MNSIILLILLLFIIYTLGIVYFDISANPNKLTNKLTNELIEEKVESLYQLLDFLHSNIPNSLKSTINKVKSIRIIPNEKETWTQNKQIIHLVIWNPQTQQLYDDNTLISALIHEFAHILCPETNHTPLFLKIETTLLKLAQSSHLYYPSKPIDLTYPCEL